MTLAKDVAGSPTTGSRLPARWRALSPLMRAVVVAVGAVAGINLLLVAIDTLYPSPGGPRSSSYATGADGLAGYASLLRDHGHEVERLRTEPSDESLDPSNTVVLLDPDVVLPEEAEALGRFVERGGRLVAGGPDPGWLGSVVDAPPVWSPEAIERADLLAPVSQTAGVRSVATAGDGSWSSPGGTLPVLGDPTGTLLVVSAQGEGSVALLADASTLHNRLLASEDNAALGLALAGSPGRPVSFVEAVHGFGSQRGLAALPDRWKLALAGLGLAALLLVLARGRRLGPPEDEERPLPPPRRAYVEALAAALDRTGRPVEASAPVRVRARELVAQRAGLDRGTGGPELERAATRLGLEAAGARALAGEAGDEEAALAAGRALATLERGAHPRAS